MSDALHIEAKIMVHPLGRTTNPGKPAKGHNLQTPNGLLTGHRVRGLYPPTPSWSLGCWLRCKDLHLEAQEVMPGLLFWGSGWALKVAGKKEWVPFGSHFSGKGKKRGSIW